MMLEQLHHIRYDTVNDNIYYMRIGLLVGRVYPDLAQQLLQYTTLTENATVNFTTALNKALGISITKGMPLPDVWSQVYDAIEQQNECN